MLLVEDDNAINKPLKMLLEQKGFRVTLATTLMAALSHLDPPPDWILLDLMLPDGDGVMVLEQVRQKQLPTQVAVTTGVAELDHVARVRALRPSALLRKPVKLESLLQMLGLP